MPGKGSGMRGLPRADFERCPAQPSKLPNGGLLTVAASKGVRLALVDVVPLAFGGAELVELWPGRPFKALRNCEAIHPAGS